MPTVNVQSVIENLFEEQARVEAEGELLADRVASAIDPEDLSENDEALFASLGAVLYALASRLRRQRDRMVAWLASLGLIVDSEELDEVIVDRLNPLLEEANDSLQEFRSDLETHIRESERAGVGDAAIAASVGVLLTTVAAILRRLASDLAVAHGQSIIDSATDSTELEMRQQGAGGRWRWVSVRDSRSCRDCDSRHGVVRSFAEWLELGPPRSRVLRCVTFSPSVPRCRCLLLPEQVAVPSAPLAVGEAIRRGRSRAKAEA